MSLFDALLKRPLPLPPAPRGLYVLTAEDHAAIRPWLTEATLRAFHGREHYTRFKSHVDDSARMLGRIMKCDAPAFVRTLYRDGHFHIDFDFSGRTIRAETREALHGVCEKWKDYLQEKGGCGFAREASALDVFSVRSGTLQQTVDIYNGIVGDLLKATRQHLPRDKAALRMPWQVAGGRNAA